MIATRASAVQWEIENISYFVRFKVFLLLLLLENSSILSNVWLLRPTPISTQIEKLNALTHFFKCFYRICYFEVIINVTNQSSQTYPPLLPRVIYSLYWLLWLNCWCEGWLIHKYYIAILCSLEKTSLESWTIISY